MLKILGIEIENKTDILAFAAFLIALLSLGATLAGWLQGSQVNLFRTHQVLIQRYESEGRIWLSLGAQMIYVNKARAEYGGVVQREKIRFSLDGATYELTGQRRGSFDSKDGKLTFARDSDARPFAIKGGDAISHETHFVSWPIPCRPADKTCDPARNFLEWPKFLAALKQSLGERKRIEILFITAASLYGAGLWSPAEVRATCKVFITKYFIRTLEERGWSAPPCWVG